MKNEIVRKLTSLTLMTIMFAGGLTFAIPGVMPEASAAHNANLFVSAENAASENTVAGPMVVEIAITDAAIDDTNEDVGEPRVTVNGQDVRMVQSNTGSWYAYIADVDLAQEADETVLNAGSGLDFGTFCTAASAGLAALGAADVTFFASTQGVAFPNTPTTGSQGTDALGGCTDDGAAANTNNVVRKARALSNPGADNIGQLDLDQQETFPFIQLYDFSVGGEITITYHTTPVQTTVLNFDDEMAGIGQSLDRTSYPASAHVQFTATDWTLNIDPTDNDLWTWQQAGGTEIFYQMFNFDDKADTVFVDQNDLSVSLGDLNFDEGVLTIDTLVSGAAVVLEFVDNDDSEINLGGGGFDATDDFTTLVETSVNSGDFRSWDAAQESTIRITDDAARGTTGSIDYADPQTVLVANFFGTITMDEESVGNEWNSGEELPIVLVDQDLNLNSRDAETLDLTDATRIWPAISIGDPITLASGDLDDIRIHDAIVGTACPTIGNLAACYSDAGAFEFADPFSDVAILTITPLTTIDEGDSLFFDLDIVGVDVEEFLTSGTEQNSEDFQDGVFQFLNFDIRSLDIDLDTLGISIAIYDEDGNVLVDDDTDKVLVADGGPGGELDDLAGITDLSGLIDISEINQDTLDDIGDADSISIGITFTDIVTGATILEADDYTLMVDLFRFGMTGDGDDSDQRFNDAIYRLEAEETGLNTGTFEGTVAYIMLNQINIFNIDTYTDISTNSDDLIIIAHEDLTEEDAPRTDYNDRGGDGVITPIADQTDAPTHSGVVSLNTVAYKVADTVTITVTDQDLNVDVDLIDIYSVVDPDAVPANPADDMVAEFNGFTFEGENSRDEPLAKLLNVEFDGVNWGEECGANDDDTAGLFAAGFSLIETGVTSGIFTGDFQIPAEVCDGADFVSSTGSDIGVNYVDFRDGSGQIIEIGQTAAVRANTGSVALDRTVYPVPFATFNNYEDTDIGTAPDDISLFPIHATGLVDDIDTDNETLPEGTVLVHIRINDPDFNLNAAGSDSINVARVLGNPAGGDHGPLKIMVTRGTDTALLATAGAATARTGVITNGADIVDAVASAATARTRELGPIDEVAPDAGIFEVSVPVRFTDGPANADCPANPDQFTSSINNQLTADKSQRFRDAAEADLDLGIFDTDGRNCILQGDILTVEYLDPTDSTGNPRTATDSATFDLRNGVLQSDKSVYIIGSDMILTLIEPDFDRDTKTAETYTLDLIEWDSDAFATTIFDEVVAFDPEPSSLRETGDDTGIFQTVVEIPDELDGTALNRGEQIDLEYTDWGPAGARYVGQDDQDIDLTIFTSNFGATVELDQKVYTWTDKVYITVVAPDHNFDSNIVDAIGTDRATNEVRVQTRTAEITLYMLAETGTDTGIFSGEVILAGFQHDADGDGEDDILVSDVADGDGPTDGTLSATNSDGITISFEFNEDETVVGSALIRWNIGEVSWLESSYPATATGVVRIVDSDMNINPEAIDNFEVDVWSDSDAGGISLVVTETNEATGIFEGTVTFTITDPSSGQRLRVAEGDTITAEYEDNTLPDPYTTADELEITGTAIIGTVVPPLERAPAANARVVDASGNALTDVRVDRQVQIAADLSNGQDRDQKFVYLVQVEDASKTVVSLTWITGTLTAGQSFSPAQSWTPDAPGSYTATVFVWESLGNPTALSPTIETTINVS